MTTPTVDLTSCDREPIHIPGRIQPFGFLLAATADFTVVANSANAGDHLKCDDIKGRPLAELFGQEATAQIRSRLMLAQGADAVERLFAVTIRDGLGPFDLAVHRSGDHLIIEGEPSEADISLNSGEVVRGMLSRLRNTHNFESFCQTAARQIKWLTGFDRVMVYRFDPDGAGAVIAEAAEPNLESFLGLHYPASDIPKQARILYMRNWLRIIADIDDKASPIEPDIIDGVPLDLSMSVTRAVSPIHIEYLRNMGVRASLSISILHEGRLWGLFACHHYSPRRISFERRTAAELFGQMFSWVLESRERERDVAYESRARLLHNQMMAGLAAGKPGAETLRNFLGSLRDIISCDGVGVWLDGKATLSGSTPSVGDFERLVRHFQDRGLQDVFATNELGKTIPNAGSLVDNAAGVLAIPVSRATPDYLVFFRNEVARSVHWAGDPNKPVTAGPLGDRLTPRKSFELWREVVRGQSAHWTESDLRIASSLRVTLLEVIFRLTDAAEKERKSAQERQELLIAELNHRVRNILSLIRGLITQGRHSTLTAEEFASVVGGRIEALARAHDLITKTNWGPGSVRTLIEEETAAYLGGKAQRVIDQGPDVALEPEAFSTLALVVHELVTNSAKYGALCDSTGVVNITWELGDAGQLIIAWQESGGPPVQPPLRRGFGTTIIERSIPYDLAGESEIHYELLGLRARLVIPARFVKRVRPTDRKAQAKPAKETKSMFSGNVLVLEDNLVIAMDAEQIMSRLGAKRIELAGSVTEAMNVIAKHKIDFALLDINLGAENSIPVAMRLRELNVPFAFATGYGEGAPLPPELKDAPIVQKPYMPETIVTVMPVTEREV
ncbi:MAG: GAF domain-containing protein [Pseudolabrys sp.]|nr:GAF domain-containing protein [Pseudolabrys sp.]